MLGNFYGIPQGKLNTCLCLNIKEKCNKQCTEQSPVATSGSTWSLKRCITSKFLIYSCTSTSPKTDCTGHLSPAMCSSLCPALLPKCGPELGPLSSAIPGGLQGTAEAVSYHQGKFYSLASSPYASGIPASRQFNPFLHLGILAFHATSFFSRKLQLLSS